MGLFWKRKNSVLNPKKCGNTVRSKNVKKCIRMGITVLNIVIWGGESQIANHRMNLCTCIENHRALALIIS